MPSDYRLDHVTARLIERLEGARPTFGTDAEAALASFRQTAAGHVEAAVREYRALGGADDAEEHARFLRREVLETAIPRYTRLAMEMARAEERNFGFGPLAEPVGRLGLVVVALLVLWFALVRLMSLPVVWPLVLLDLSLPLWPTIAAGLYRRQLEDLVGDMTRIQENERYYLTQAELGPEDR